MRPWRSRRPAGAFEATDLELLRRAWKIIPRMPFDPLDMLVVDEMGKNISGTGMDTNVIGVGRRAAAR